jgi:S-disulfanyl-L-cysteine oxidoreductase SoxD
VVRQWPLQRDLQLGRERQREGKYAAAVVALAFHAGAAMAADAPHFGQPISPADAAAWDISIGPDGVGLPPGSGTPARGAVVYAQKCAACRGDKGEGKTNAGLGRPDHRQWAGGQTVGSYWPYATTLFDFVRRAMTWTAPKSLTNDVLRMNNIIGENDVMDAKSRSNRLCDGLAGWE